jgi:hypothetical protein
LIDVNGPLFQRKGGEKIYLFRFPGFAAGPDKND